MPARCSRRYFALKPSVLVSLCASMFPMFCVACGTKRPILILQPGSVAPGAPIWSRLSLAPLAHFHGNAAQGLALELYSVFSSCRRRRKVRKRARQRRNQTARLVTKMAVTSRMKLLVHLRKRSPCDASEFYIMRNMNVVYACGPAQAA